MIHNAQLFAADGVDESRMDILEMWQTVFKDECKDWQGKAEEDESYLSKEEQVFVLLSVAFELVRGKK